MLLDLIELVLRILSIYIKSIKTIIPVYFYNKNTVTDLVVMPSKQRQQEVQNISN